MVITKNLDVNPDNYALTPIGIDPSSGHLLLVLPTDLPINLQSEQFDKTQLSNSFNLFQKALAQTSDRQAISIIYEALEQLGTVEVSLPEQTDRQDEYFCVKHIKTPAISEMLLASVLNSYLEFLKCQFNSSHPETMDAMELWVKLHWIFFSLTQGLIISIRSLEKALKAQDIIQAEIDLKTASILMKASGESMKISGALTPIQYNDIVRDSMPPGLSGQEGQDHIYFRKLSRKLKLLSDSLSNSLTPSIRNGFKNYYVAAKLTYDAHIHVCTRFIGLEEPSLRQKVLLEQKPHLAKISAVDELLRTKRKIDQELDFYSHSTSKCPLKLGFNMNRQFKNRFTQMMSQLALGLKLPYPLSRQKSVKVMKQGYQEYANLLGRVFDLHPKVNRD